MKRSKWFTRCRPNYEKQPMSEYTIIIHGPNDPERKPRPAGGQADRFPHHTLSKLSESQIAKLILDLLSDGEARTLNRIGIEIWDKPSSILSGSKVEEVLWELVMDGTLEFTRVSPILFRTTDKRLVDTP